MEQVKFIKLRLNAVTPCCATEHSAGADLHACIDKTFILPPHTTATIPTGLALAIPNGYAGFVFARSGIATKRDLAPANKVGVIDSDYRGELLVALHNHGDAPQRIEPDERIAQLVLLPVASASFIQVQSLDETSRGSGGFGSTGQK